MKTSILEGFRPHFLGVKMDTDVFGNGQIVYSGQVLLRFE